MLDFPVGTFFSITAPRINVEEFDLLHFHKKNGQLFQTLWIDHRYWSVYVLIGGKDIAFKSSILSFKSV